MLESLEENVRRVAPAVDRWTVRGLREHTEELTTRQGVLQPLAWTTDQGLMVTVTERGYTGHAATSDGSEQGLIAAFGEALVLAQAAEDRALRAPRTALVSARTQVRSAVARPVSGLSLADRIGLLRQAEAGLAAPGIVDWSALLHSTTADQLFLTSEGARIEQERSFVRVNLSATASVDGVTEIRTSAGQSNGFIQQGGLEILDRAGFLAEAPRVAAEALELARAPRCPTGTLDLLLMPDQMLLQIHESIGHPIELDRILGDERNFAGTSFVTPEMFGTYRYGSELLNICYDPSHAEQIATFDYDDDGTRAERAMLIERGLLVRPLGGASSVARARERFPGLSGVATARASSWNRPTIDRMSNLNMVPGTSTLDEMIASIELGVVMRTNRSWSIDDSRNKFQFGCEHGQMIRDGRLAEVVRSPNYRGISAQFWRSLRMVGDRSTYSVMGTPYCGKGEPIQIVRVGHAAPAALFSGVSVFGGEA